MTDLLICNPVLIGLDWGTSSLRAFLMGERGTVLDQRSSRHGIQNLPAEGREGFETAFRVICGSWVDRYPGVPVVAGGMVGSAQGWTEAPYVACPADVETLAEHAASVETASGVRVLIAPGVLYDPADAAPDVMRGEEIQIAGALARTPAWAGKSLMALPGTHSKWARVRQGRIEGFSTHMTGELFSILRRHSILGRLMADDPQPSVDAVEAAFLSGVSKARDEASGDLLHQLFSVRTLSLRGRLAPTLSSEYLSGLLIGHELRSVLSSEDAGEREGLPLALIGDVGLCRRYARALTVFGVGSAALCENTAPPGLFCFASAARLIPPADEVSDVR
ncbi:2-dehydro-3-deoxygalactonokinase [Consotaella aegiceratis]|uniref:2-dehydro-3-deoxygalactonokinase n=1 Tax=Consotaella aegiceratis TaxID=3097961 RepID=UPI002F3FF63D